MYYVQQFTRLDIAEARKAELEKAGLNVSLEYIESWTNEGYYVLKIDTENATASYLKVG